MIIFRTLTKEIIVITAVSLLVLVLIFTSTQLMIYLNMMEAGKLSSAIFSQLCGVIAMGLIGMLLPIAFFVALLLTYARLYSENAMTILFLSGFTHRHLFFYTFSSASIVIVITALLSLWILPHLFVYQNNLLAQTSAVNLLQTITPGRFHESLDKKRIFYAEAVSIDHRYLNRLFIAEREVVSNPFSSVMPVSTEPNDESRWDILLSQYAHQEDQPERGGEFLLLEKGHRYIGSPGQRKFILAQYETYGIKLPPPHEALFSDWADRKSTSTALLIKNYRTDIFSASELQWRISTILQVFILAWLSIPLSKTAPRQGRYMALLPAILIYIVYANALFISRNWINTGLVSPRLGLWWVHGILLFLALGLYYKTHLKNLFFNLKKRFL